MFNFLLSRIKDAEVGNWCGGGGGVVAVTMTGRDGLEALQLRASPIRAVQLGGCGSAGISFLRVVPRVP
jgi:hypothetical protein